MEPEQSKHIYTIPSTVRKTHTHNYTIAHTQTQCETCEAKHNTKNGVCDSFNRGINFLNCDNPRLLRISDEEPVAEAIVRATDEIAGQGKSGVPDLTMVDLSGITRFPENIYKQISEFIKPEESILLNVLINRGRGLWLLSPKLTDLLKGSWKRY